MNPTHAELQDLLGVYALDAVDPDERALVEAHLEQCPQCRSEMEGHRAVASMLGNAGGAGAPDALWDRIAGSLEGDVLTDDRNVATIPLFAAPPTPAAGRNRRRRPSVAVMITSIAAAGLLVIGLAGISTIRSQQQKVDDLAAQVADSATNRSAAGALADPDSTLVQLTSPGDELVLRAVVTDDGVGYLLGNNLPDLGQASTYQLWGATESQTVSLGVLGSEPGVFEFHLDDPVTALAITREQAGGVEQSVKQPLVSGPLVAEPDATTVTS